MPGSRHYRLLGFAPRLPEVHTIKVTPDAYFSLRCGGLGAAMSSNRLGFTMTAAIIRHHNKPGFPRWIGLAGPEAAEMLAKLPAPSFTRRVRQNSAT